MTEESASYRRILRSTSIIGGATAVSILLGLVRMKLITLLVGAAGVGLFGVFNAIVMTGQLFAGLGTNTSGMTSLAASPDEGARARIRISFWTLTWLLAAVSLVVFWVFRRPIAEFAGGGAVHATAVGLLGLAVALNLIANAQLGVLQGFGRIGDIGRVKLYGALLAAVLGVAAVYVDPYYGLAVALISVPLALLIVGLRYGARLPRLDWPTRDFGSLFTEWRALVANGFGLMLWFTMGSASQIAVRAILVEESGLETAGLFQAAAMISANSQILILAGMLNDYLTRLSGVAGDRNALNKLLDQQLHVALLLAAALIAGMIAVAPLALTILYSAEFTGATRLLQWQVLGDALKIVGWSLSFVLIARRDMVAFLAAELVFNLLYVGMVALLFPRIGLEGAGIAYCAAYALYCLLIVAVCRHRQDIGMSRTNARLTAAVLLTLLAIVLVAGWSLVAAFAAGAVAAIGFSLAGLRQLAHASGVLPARLRPLAARMGIR